MILIKLCETEIEKKEQEIRFNFTPVRYFFYVIDFMHRSRSPAPSFM